MATLAVAVSNALVSCGPMESTYYPLNQTGTPAEVGKRPLELSSSEFAADLVTPAGIRVKTNGQYKTEDVRKAAAVAIDRYWGEVRACKVGVERPGDTDVGDLVEEFPRHLAVEISDNWKVVEGPTTHRRMQAFPSLAHPGTWSTARRQEDALYIVVVPELNGLGPQMVNELNLWLMKNANVPPTADLLSACASVACVRFNYNNAPSQVWNECKE
ncbi:MAG TPA: hypothetical protein VJX68_05330 [Candidatus Binatus sp.]|uniref:hypothetical protein n=1 Tax=Candidatus Binatus sp. TaxID=2811406 RepID=UPI002B45EE64|nr:hypothetical protein [Candidatus Binatus sp.]HKN12600.1 hypothetical protein [Candidatus Binatus sp.]